MREKKDSDQAPNGGAREKMRDTSAMRRQRRQLQTRKHATTASCRRLFSRGTKRFQMSSLLAKESREALSHVSLIHSRSEEHTSELQSHSDLVCRLLLEKKTGRTLTN